MKKNLFGFIYTDILLYNWICTCYKLPCGTTLLCTIVLCAKEEVVEGSVVWNTSHFFVIMQVECLRIQKAHLRHASMLTYVHTYSHKSKGGDACQCLYMMTCLIIDCFSETHLLKVGSYRNNV